MDSRAKTGAALLALIVASLSGAFAAVAMAGDDSATTTTSIELGPATAVTRPPVSAPDDIEVKGTQVVADDQGTSWVGGCSCSSSCPRSVLCTASHDSVRRRGCDY